jgi:hypothetical protein
MRRNCSQILALMLCCGLLNRAATAAEHWAFKPIVRPAVPQLVDGGTGAIDAFIRHRLEQAGIKPSAPAQKTIQLRRLLLDLHGLPPTGEEVAAFQGGDKSYEQIVDDALASSRYGERWAQHWLDVVRYADTHGFEVNTPRANAWPYRDYVIRAFNEDKPYDRFILEQLAGDSVGEDAATGFLVAAAVLLPGQIGKDDVSKRLARQDSLDEIIVGTCDTFLGLTVGCARCHDHKFDPVTQRDYYAMQAFFSGVEYGDRPIESEESRKNQERARQLEPGIGAIDRQLREYEPRVFSGRTILIDDEDGQFTTHLAEKAGHGANPAGTKRGYLGDEGGAKRLPNLSRGRYTWWRHQAGEDVFTYNPATAGEFRVWISWGAHGSGVHTHDARYVLDRDGDLDTTADQSEIARIDQYHFAGVTEGETEKKPLWSGIHDAGIHRFEKQSRIILRGGETGTGVTADVIVLQESTDLDAERSHPYLRAPTDWKLNVERFAPVRAKYVRFTWHGTQDNDRHGGCIDELEVFSALTNSVNLAHTRHGTRPSASKAAEGGKHRLAHINDGRYGNDYSFINNGKSDGWVQLEFARPQLIDRLTWARDRTGKYKDRLAVRYTISVGMNTNDWTVVATERDRLPYATPANPATYRLRNLPPEETGQVARLVKERETLTRQRTKLSKPNLVYAGKFKAPEKTFVLRRGDPEQPIDRINARVPGVFGKLGLKPDDPEQDRRVALAEWIASPRNPLTARVMVNRIWQYHFGRGLVETSSDFGRNGAKPSHPELLDWLAAEFMENGWSIKHLHRLILNSQTYRQSNRIDLAAQTKDADCRLLWRFPSRRLEAEAIRDTLLFVSGQLNFAAGGSGFSFFKSRGGLSGFPPVTQFGTNELRRMIYQHKIRMESVPVFGAFDCPDAGQAMPQRSQSTTAIQALNLFNSPFVIAQAAALAKRIEDIAKDGSESARIKRAFQLALNRDPEKLELHAAQKTVSEHGLATLCRVLFNSNEFLFLP